MSAAKRQRTDDGPDRFENKLIAVGSQFPDVTMDEGFPPTKINMRERLAGKTTILVGLPGAFTPT